MPLEKGVVLAKKYEIQELVGRGLIFEVYRAIHTKLSKEVALKVLIPEIASDLEFTRFVIQAVRKVVSLEEHPHIAWIHDIDKDGVYIFFVMDYLPQSLKDIIEDVSIDRAVEITLDVLDALNYTHSKGLIHKDIRPSNIRLSETGSAILSDFGMAEIASKAAMKFKKTAFIPPPHYTAPEQIKSFDLADERSDIYSVGAVLYHMITKKVPFEGDIRQIYYQKLSGYNIQPLRMLNPEVPQELENVVLKALSQDPKDRFQSAQEMMEALKDIKSRLLGKFILLEFEERRSEGTFKRKIEFRESSPFRLESVEIPSVISLGQPFNMKLVFSGKGEGRVELKVPDFLSLLESPIQNFLSPCEVSWHLITTKEVYGAYELEISIFSNGLNVLKEPLRFPVLFLPVYYEIKEEGKTKRTIFRIFGIGE
jgi:Serine/threonine protein kinase